MNRLDELYAKIDELGKIDRSASYRFFHKHEEEINALVIAENKQRGVYWDKDCWVYEVVKDLNNEQFASCFSKLNGCIVEENKNGWMLTIYTPYKVYVYEVVKKDEQNFTFKAFTNYANHIVRAKDTQDMKRIDDRLSSLPAIFRL